MKSRHIDPEYSFRFSPDDFHSTYDSAEGAFADGDFLNAAQWAPQGTELKACSLMLGGLLEQGLAMLEGIPEPGGRSELCRAFAFWSLGRDVEARAALDRISDPDTTDAAARFRALLDRDNINIFITGAILSVFPEHYSASFVAPVYKYDSITVKYVGSQLSENAYDYDQATSLSDFIEGLPEEEQPDILFSLSPQWLVAKDFHKVKVPKVIWAHDSDAFQYRNVDNFALYDVGICNCSHEHFELSQGTPGIYCAANLLLHPLATPFPEASSHREKIYDIIFTGSALAPFHSEKPRFLYKLAELAGQYKVQVIEGHMPEKQYFEVISQAKFLPVVNRYAGMPSPRWRDALANGAFLLYPKETFYGEIAPGTFPFRVETMVQDIAAHLDRFNAGGNSDYDLGTVVPEINRRFSIHRQPREETYQRLLKYALFMGLVWPRPSVANSQQRQRRLCWMTPAVDAGLFGHNQIRDRISHIADSIGPDELIDHLDYHNAAHIYAQLVFTFPGSSEVARWAAQADHYLREGVRHYPESLALRFTEAHWSFFRPDADYIVAERMFRRVIADFDHLQFDPKGADIAFAYTLHEHDAVFPCYEYADVATSELVLANTPELAGRKVLPHSTRDMILAACHGYVGWARFKLGNTAGGLAEMKRSFEIYPHGLPTLRLYLDTLLRIASEAKRITSDLASDLAEAFITVVNVNPSILLTHVYTMVPLLADNGERQAAREILAAWYRLANIVHRLRTDDEKHQLALFRILWAYRSLLPATLIERVEQGLWDDQSVDNLTQLERRFIRVAVSSEAREKRRLLWPWQGRWSAPKEVERLLARSGYGKERITLSKLSRAVATWYRAPPDIRAAYRQKAYRLVRRGELLRALRRTQQWGTHSRWAAIPLMMDQPRRNWDRLQKLVQWWTKLVRDPQRRG